MERRLISVVMPVYNGAEYLRRTIESVFNQTYPLVEIVAVDDGSVDGSARVIEAFKDSRIRLFKQANSGSVGLVRNVCMARAEGEYFAFLDQDDWWLPEKLARQVDVMESSSRIGLVHTAVEHYYETAGGFGPPLNPLLERQHTKGECYDRLLMSNTICNSSVLVRRQAIEAVGMCDLQIPGNTVQDYDLWLRIAAEYELGYVPQSLSVYCMHPKQGLWDRRKMLSAELDLLLRVRNESWWRSNPMRRRRLAGVYDSLAVAHIEHGGYAETRRCMRLAARIDPSLRVKMRYLLSLLPSRVVSTLRAAKSGLSTKS